MNLWAPSCIMSIWKCLGIGVAALVAVAIALVVFAYLLGFVAWLVPLLATLVTAFVALAAIGGIGVAACRGLRL